MSLAFMVVGCVQGGSHTGTGGSSGGGTGGSGSAGSTGSGTGGGNGTAGSNGSGGATSGSGGATTSSGGHTGTAGSGAGGMTTTGLGGAPGTGGHVASGDAGTRPDLTGRTALFIVSDPNSLDDGDVLIEELLQIRGMTVTFGTIATPPAMASNFNMVIISSGIGSDTSFSVFKDVPVPMILFGNGLYQTMGFVPNSSSRGSADDTVQNVITDATTLMSSDLAMGQMFVVINTAIANTQYTWGIPGGAPIKVAALVGSPTEYVVFGYEKGAAMSVGTAAGRRVAIGWKSNAVKALTLEGFKLQDGAFSWAAGGP
jgi:hypothetical protein